MKLVTTIFFLLMMKASANEAFTFGPIINFHLSSFLDNSYGVEGAYWRNITGSRLPWGFDFGMETSQNNYSVYSELQIGLGFYGLSVGPVYENTYANPSAGSLSLQASVWLNAFIGTAYRYKASKYYKQPHALSIYYKELWDTDGSRIK